MRKSILAAAFIAGITVFLHVIGGGAEVQTPIQDSALSPFLKAISLVIWHVITVMLVVMAISLAWCARHENKPLEAAILAINFGFIGLFLFYGLSELGEIKSMAQWVIFTAIAALQIIGWRRLRSA